MCTKKEKQYNYQKKIVLKNIVDSNSKKPKKNNQKLINKKKIQKNMLFQ